MPPAGREAGKGVLPLNRLEGCGKKPFRVSRYITKNTGGKDEGNGMPKTTWSTLGSLIILPWMVSSVTETRPSSNSSLPVSFIFYEIIVILNFHVEGTPAYPQC